LWEPRTARDTRSFVLADLPPRELSATPRRRAASHDQWRSQGGRGRRRRQVRSPRRSAPTPPSRCRPTAIAVTADDDGQVGWDLGGQPWSLRLPGARVTTAGDLALIALRERTEVVFLGSGSVLRTLPAAPAALSADGARLARAAGAAVLVEDARTGKRLARVTGAERVAALALAGDRVVIHDAGDGRYRMWDWRRGRVVQPGKGAPRR
jgi:hypothetical protein